MFRFLLILLLACGTVFVARRRNDIPGAKGLLALFPFLMLLLMVVRCSPTDRAAREFVSSLRLDFDAQGYMLGREVAAHLPDGGVVVVLHPPTESDSRFRELVEAQLNGLRDALPESRYPLAIETFTPEHPMGTVSPAELAGVVRKQPGVRAAVLLSGLSLSPRDTYDAVSTPPVFLSGIPEPDDADALLRQDVVRAVILSRRGTERASNPSRELSREERFEQRYLLRVSP